MDILEIPEDKFQEIIENISEPIKKIPLMSDEIYTYRDIQKKTLLNKLKKYCAYQERCHKDVEDKLKKLKAGEDMTNEIISELIAENYLNEERFVIAYTRGKHRINKWGKRKILLELKQKEINQYLIKLGMKEIDEDEYYEMLKTLLSAKRKSIKAKNQYDLFNKLYYYAYRKGYESETIKNAIEDIV